MKQISSSLFSHLQQEVTTLATCWKLTRRDGVVMGFTDHDRDIVVSGLTYQAATGFTPTAIAGSASLDVDNLDVEGMLDAGAITQEDILAGKYDHAEIEVFRVNYAAPADGTLPLRFGWLGEVTSDGGRFVAEMRGLAQRLTQKVGELYAPRCRADLGDARCKVSMAGRTYAGSVTSVTSRSVLHDTARTEDAGLFSFGKLTFTGGANDGLSMEIKSYVPGTFTLFLPFPYDVAPGDDYMVTEGCDKTLATCAAVFDNAVNFRGEPHVPGMNRILETSTTRSVY